MNDEVAAHARRGHRYIQIVGWGIPLLLYLGFAFALTFGGISLLPALVVVLVVYLLLNMPFFRAEVNYQLVTDRSPAEVRDEIQSVDNPLAIWEYALADEGGVEVHENGATYERTQLLGLRTVRTRWETKQHSNSDLIVQSWKNGNKAPVATISVEPADETETSLTVSGFTLRASLQRLLQLWVRENSITAALRESGYEVVADETRYGFR